MNQREELSEVSELAVRAELDHVLDSPAFRTSKRCREFLTYIVEHTLRGPSLNLKERSIGVDLFHLPSDFDTGQHTIVRVTASEVRKKLAQHYIAENGSMHSVRIDLPPGSYSADFKWTAPTTPVLETKLASVQTEVLPIETEALPKRASGLDRRVLVFAVLLLAIAGGVTLWRVYSNGLHPQRMDSSTIAAAPLGTPAGESTVRMIVGATDSYVDRSGRVWGADRYFSGGSVVIRPSEKISRTLDPDIYRHVRQGDFRYDIPLQSGSYELHLYFAETGLADFISAESSGEGQRIFRVLANGKALLDYFDVVADANGSNTADERVFADIAPAEDGFLHLSFTPIRGTAILSGIELVAANPTKIGAIRIRAGWPASWRDTLGRSWNADAYFLGGNALVRSTNPVRGNDSMSPDMALYASERWGHFSYALPVAEGRYKVTLRFSEGHYGHRNTGVGGLGSRVFDVYCNGIALLRNFDIYKEAGGEGRPVDRAFSGLQPNAQGKLVLSFVPVKGMACVNGIEVVEDLK